MKFSNLIKSKVSKVVSTAVLPVLTMGAMTAPAQAELSSDLTIASTYLWRGQAISGFHPAMSSTVQYDHSSGLYVGTWFSNEGLAGSYEVDAYAGYGLSIGDISLGLGAASYFYPQTEGNVVDSGIYEGIVSAGFKDLSVTAYINLETPADYTYISADYSIGKVGVHAGYTLQDSAYTDVNLSYALTDALTWTVSYAFGDGIADTPDAGGIRQDEPVVVVSYSVPLK